MLGSAFEADDAVQETMVRAWRSIDRYEGRGPFEAWLFRIATNVCLNSFTGAVARAMPMDLGPAAEPATAALVTRPGATWVGPVPDAWVLAPTATVTRPMPRSSGRPCGWRSSPPCSGCRRASGRC